MTVYDPRKQAGLTKRANTRTALVDAAESVFTDADYSTIKVDHVFGNAGVSSASYYNIFSSKSAWGAAVLDQRLSDALDQEAATVTEPSSAPHARLLGHFGLLAQVSVPLPGITKALIEERTDGRATYGELVPRYHGEVTQAFAHGQEQHVFRGDLSPASLADFALDSIALAYAVHLDNPAARVMTTSLVLDGLQVVS